MVATPAVTIVEQPSHPSLTVVGAGSVPAVEVVERPVQPVLQVLPSASRKVVEVTRPVNGAGLREVQAYIDARLADLDQGNSSGGAPRSYSIASASSYTATHGLSYAPETWILTPDGEVLETDTHHSPAPSP